MNEGKKKTKERDARTVVDVDEGARTVKANVVTECVTTGDALEKARSLFPPHTDLMHQIALDCDP